MRVLTGLQPSGPLHLGNYFGALKPFFASSARAKETFLFVADLHALTTMRDPKAFRQTRRECVLDVLACGLDPENVVFFHQSDIPEHTELSWILACVAPMSLLERAVSFKEKVAMDVKPTVGLFNYPVLQAADILLYRADRIPVGQDQKQHLEIARDLAMKFNHAYGDILTVPEPDISLEVSVVPGTDGQKMSKSYHNTIPLFAPEAEIRKAVMGIVTDSRQEQEPKDPDQSVVYRLHRLFCSEKEARVLAERYRAGIGYGDAKKQLFDAIMDALAPLRKKREEWARNPDAVQAILEDGKAKAGEVAQETMAHIRQAVGLS